MQRLWIIGLLAVALLGSACAFGNTTATTTTVKKSTTSTTAGKAASSTTPGAKDKVACADYAKFKSSTVKPTAKEFKELIGALRRAENSKLRSEGGALGKAVLYKPAELGHVESRVSEICSGLGLG